MDLENIVAGIDEVGRGCLAGPLVAAVVILKEPINGLMDSKMLSKQNREQLAVLIKQKAQAYAIGWTESDEINARGLTYAVSNAMRQAVVKLNTKYDKIIIDGNYNYLPDFQNVSVIVKADKTVATVSAASIIAKVYRDNWMNQLAKLYPEYGFEKHVGYGTKLHLDNLEKFGPSPIHRMFYKPLLKFKT